MVKRSRGFFSKANRKMKMKRKITVNDRLKTFKIGEKVIIKAVAEHSTAPHRRYHGKAGRVVEKRGSAYVVEIKDGGKVKKIITTPVHLKKI